jgi:integrase
VGEYLDAVKANAELRAVTFEIYARKFRTLLAGVFGVKAGPEKFDYVNGGRAKWMERIHASRLDRLTTERVERWKVDFLKAAEKKNPLAYKRARVTINSVIRGAKSLFAASVVSRVKLKLPDPLPLAGVANVPVERARYRSKVDPKALLVAAKNELAEAQPEQFKVLLLALGAGLRRDEIDTLTWKQIDWQRNVIRVETNVHTAAKSAASEGEVDVDASLLAILKDYRKPGAGEFVIRSLVQPRKQAGASYHYRSNRVFDGLIRWLRSKGVESTNPLHTLRKEFGSLIAAQGGIFAASLALRHADIQLTRDFYLDKKQTVVLDIGKLLDTRAKPPSHAAGTAPA